MWALLTLRGYTIFEAGRSRSQITVRHFIETIDFCVRNPTQDTRVPAMTPYYATLGHHKIAHDARALMLDCYFL